MLDHQHHQQPFHHCRRSSLTCTRPLQWPWQLSWAPQTFQDQAEPAAIQTPMESHIRQVTTHPKTSVFPDPPVIPKFWNSKWYNWRKNTIHGNVHWYNSEIAQETSALREKVQKIPMKSRCKTFRKSMASAGSRVDPGSIDQLLEKRVVFGKGRKICQTIHFGLHFWDVKGLAALPMALQSICARIWLVRVVRERKILTLGWEKVRYLHWH